MVERKGVGYAVEAIVAVATVIIFIFGGLQVPPGQDWSDFRTQVSYDDITYSLQDSGYINHALSEGEVGSVQTAFSTLTERSVEVSGLVSNLPIMENNVGFYTSYSSPDKRLVEALDPVGGGDTCEGDLEEISTRSEEPVLRSEGGITGSTGTRVYVGDLDPNQVGGNSDMDYDSVWVDNGTQCQFSDAEGPYYLDEFIKWGPENYDIEGINGNIPEMRLYKSSQVVRFRNMLNNEVNSVDTFVTVDAVNFSEISTNDYNVVVIRGDNMIDDLTNAHVLQVLFYARS